MRVTLFVEGLRPGGAERVISEMANFWGAQGRPVTLITLEPPARDFYPLHPNVRRIAWSPPGRLRSLAQNTLGFGFLRRAITASRPDVVVSFLDESNVRALACTLDLKIPIVISERSDPRQYRLRARWRLLRRAFYPLAGALVVQSRAVAGWAEKMVEPRKVRVIPNPVRLMTLDAAPCDPGEPVVMSMGRLIKTKGFDLLLDAFAEIAPRFPEWRLRIIGEGEERPALLAQAARLGLTDRFELPGLIADPAPLLRQAGVYALSSRYEGFPNALLEAMACARPVVAFDCPAGPREIIRDELDGLLVAPGRSDALAAALARLLASPSERARFASRAPEVRERFSLPRVMAKWDRLFSELV
jgi:glycosyltransferase involved in cell wall biosynthesis